MSRDFKHYRKPDEPETVTAEPEAEAQAPAPVQVHSHVILDNTSNQISNVFYYAALADKIAGTLYTDATEALPVRSINGYQYYFVVYDYDTN